MVDLSSITFLQGLLIVYSGFHPVSGNYGKCMCELGNHINCSQVRCPGNKCGDSTFSDNLTCVCKTVKTTKIGCQVLRINRCDLEFEVRSCSELHPFICSDSNYNFQIYQDEDKTWPEAVKTCESRHLQIARVNLCVLHSPSNVSFWTGTFYGLASDNDTDVSQFQILASNTSTLSAGIDVKCETESEMCRMPTKSVTPSQYATNVSISTSSDTVHTTSNSQTVMTYSTEVRHGNTEGTTRTTPLSVSQTHRSIKVSTSTVRSWEDTGGHHGNVNVAAIAGAISGIIVLAIVVVLVVYVGKIRTTKKTNNKDVRLSDIVSIAGHADQSLKSRDYRRSQNPIYHPGEHTVPGEANLYGQYRHGRMEFDEENMYDHFQNKHRHSDVDSGNDTYDHLTQIDGYGFLHLKYDDLAGDVYDHETFE